MACVEVGDNLISRALSLTRYTSERLQEHHHCRGRCPDVMHPIVLRVIAPTIPDASPRCIRISPCSTRRIGIRGKQSIGTTITRGSSQPNVRFARSPPSRTCYRSHGSFDGLFCWRPKGLTQADPRHLRMCRHPSRPCLVFGKGRLATS